MTSRSASTARGCISSMARVSRGRIPPAGPGPAGGTRASRAPAAAQRPAAAARASNQYHFQLERAWLVSAPIPTATALPYLTERVARNNFYFAELVANDAAVMAFL